MRLLLLTTLAATLSACVSDQDIKDCVDQTGWSAERCKTELMR